MRESERVGGGETNRKLGSTKIKQKELGILLVDCGFINLDSDRRWQCQRDCWTEERTKLLLLDVWLFIWDVTKQSDKEMHVWWQPWSKLKNQVNCFSKTTHVSVFVSPLIRAGWLRICTDFNIGHLDKLSLLLFFCGSKISILTTLSSIFKSSNIVFLRCFAEIATALLQDWTSLKSRDNFRF